MKGSYYFISTLSLIFSFIAIDTWAASPPITYNWQQSKSHEIYCYAYNSRTGAILYGAEPVDGRNCESPLPITYNWQQSKSHEIYCYAYNSRNGAILYGAQPVDGRNCESPLPITYNWQQSKSHEIYCYAYNSRNGAILYGAQPVDPRFCLDAPRAQIIDSQLSPRSLEDARMAGLMEKAVSSGVQTSALIEEMDSQSKVRSAM